MEVNKNDMGITLCKF